MVERKSIAIKEQDDLMNEMEVKVGTWKSSDSKIMADSLKEEAKKQPFAFKFEKKSKLKTNLQGSVVKAFINPKDLHDSKKVKKEPLKLDLMCEGCNEELEKLCEEEEELTYTEPSWGGKPDDVYKIKVLEAGITSTKLDISLKSYYVIGNSQSCDINISHETVSIFHAILQYRKTSDSENEKGMHIYDLNSEFGTFLNSNRIKPFTHTLVHHGDKIHFGNSPKKYILQISMHGEEKEDQLSSEESEQQLALQDVRGINWGMADCDENSNEDSENDDSYDDEELFMSDPKKSLRDWFKWEGYDLEYQTEDKGFGKFSCCIDLTLNPFSGETERIQVDVVGDKMKAIDECALQACRFLNDNGLLRQAHEEKKSTSKNWEEVDYYDSDEDIYLDRTGIIERKRQHRMQLAGKPDSKNESILKEHSRIENRIRDLERLLTTHNTSEDKEENPNEDRRENPDEDTLDSYMSRLDTSNLNKTDVRNIKAELHNLYKEKQVIYNSIT